MNLDVIFVIYLTLVSAALVLSLVYRENLSSFGPYLSILLVFVLIFDAFDNTLSGYERNVLDHFYQPLEFTLLTLIYGRVLIYKWFVGLQIYLIVIFWALSMFLSFFVEGLHTFNTSSLLIGNFLIVVMTLIYQYQLLTKPTTDGLFRIPFFWINTANLFFYVGTFFQMGLNSYLKEHNHELAEGLVIINYILNFMLYILYIVGIICRVIFK